MEQKPEEINPNKAIRSAELSRRRDGTSSFTNEAAGCSSVAPSNLGMSSSTIRPRNSAFPNLRRVSFSLKNDELSDSIPSLTSPYPTNDARFRVDEMIARNYENSNAHIVYKDKGLLGSSLRENFRQEILTLQDPKNLLSSQSNMDSYRIPTRLSGSPSSIITSSTIGTHAMEGPSNIMPNNRPIEGSFSSSLSKLSNERTLKIMGKRIINENSGVSDKSLANHSALTTQNENMQGDLSREAYDTSMNENSLSSQPYSHDIVRKGVELSHYGINLREWLESKCFNASKSDRLCLFRKIVQIVDTEHRQGIALTELRPSSFIIFKTGDIKYIGSWINTESWSLNQYNTKKRGLELEFSAHDFREKMQKVGADKLVRPDTSFISKGTSTGNNCLTPDNAQLEKKWYAFPKGFKIGDLLSSNIYSLGLLLFELLCHSDSIEAHSAAMLDLHYRILPPYFLSENPKEAGFCFWLLHPEPSSRPTTREILQSELILGYDSTNLNNDRASCADDMADEADSDVLLDFLVSLKVQTENRASNLLRSMQFLDEDLKVIESRQTCRKSLDMIGCHDLNLKDQPGAESPCSTSKMNALKDKLLANINELENIYFTMRSDPQLTEKPKKDRPDKDVLTMRERVPWVQDPSNLPTKEDDIVDHLGMFFDGICKFVCYNKFEVCGTFKSCDMLNTDNVMSSIGFDRDEQYLAAAGVSKKIKIFELDSLLDDGVDVHYPIFEMSGESKFSCISWNNYIKNYLVSTDYDGLVQLWNASSGQDICRYTEHRKRAWSVDFSRVDPTKFATGGDDCSLKIWNINERSSTCTLSNLSNVCCVQFSPYSSHLLAFGSSDFKINCYDLRHTRIPWCTLTGHDKAVSYVKFLDSETIVSASIDSTLKLWDLKKTTLLGSSPDACSLTCRGHTNEMNFVGMSVLDGYIACGSETNEVYAYHRSLPMPIARHEFVTPVSADHNFVSSVCWRRNTQMLAAANSNGSIEMLRMV